MKVYNVIEMSDCELLSVRTFRLESDAHDAFNSCADGQEYDKTDLDREVTGTLRLVGDDTYSVQLIETDCT